MSRHSLFMMCKSKHEGVGIVGTITIKVPQDIQLEYEIDTIDLMIEGLLEQLKRKKQQVESGGRDLLLGLFADDADVLDEITESAMQARERDPLRSHDG